MLEVAGAGAGATAELETELLEEEGPVATGAGPLPAEMLDAD